MAQKRSAALTPDGGGADIQAGRVVEIVELVTQHFSAENDLVGQGVIDTDAVEIPVPAKRIGARVNQRAGRAHGAVEQRGAGIVTGLEADAADRVGACPRRADRCPQH